MKFVNVEMERNERLLIVEASTKRSERNAWHSNGPYSSKAAILVLLTALFSLVNGQTTAGQVTSPWQNSQAWFRGIFVNPSSSETPSQTTELTIDELLMRENAKLLDEARRRARGPVNMPPGTGTNPGTNNQIYFNDAIQDTAVPTQSSDRGLKRRPERDVLRDRQLVELDMLLTTPQHDGLYAAVESNTGRRKKRAVAKYFYWSTRIIPYVNELKGITPSQQDNLDSALKTFRDYTCLEFREYSSSFARKNLADYITFISDEGCWSSVGPSGQAAPLSLASSCLLNPMIVFHELMHSLGFFHEQSRWDRDEHVDIVYDNIDKEYRDAFARYQRTFLEADDSPYDYTSLMHYGSHYFSANGKATIVTKDRKYQSIIGQRRKPSFEDLRQVNMKYNCIKRTDQCPELKGVCPPGAFLDHRCRCMCPVDFKKVYNVADELPIVPCDPVRAAHGQRDRSADRASFAAPTPRMPTGGLANNPAELLSPVVRAQNLRCFKCAYYNDKERCADHEASRAGHVLGMLSECDADDSFCITEYKDKAGRGDVVRRHCSRQCLSNQHCCQSDYCNAAARISSTSNWRAIALLWTVVVMATTVVR